MGVPDGCAIVEAGMVCVGTPPLPDTGVGPWLSLVGGVLMILGLGLTRLARKEGQ